MKGRVDVVEYLGADTYLYVTPKGHATMIVRVAGTETVQVGDDVALVFEKDFICFFDEDGQAIR
jgi:multiple sugar transport system ATP-binding protein